MREKPKTPNFRKIKRDILRFLDALPDKKRLGRIDDFLHLLNYERRVTMLTPEERVHMDGELLPPEMKKRIREASSEKEREELIAGWARTIYFRRCAWVDYLNGGREEKPFTSVPKADKAKAA